MLYILSAWLYSRLVLSQVQRLIRDFLWGSTNCSYVRAKVCWKIVTTPGLLLFYMLVDVGMGVMFSCMSSL